MTNFYPFTCLKCHKIVCSPKDASIFLSYKGNFNIETDEEIRRMKVEFCSNCARDITVAELEQDMSDTLEGVND